jgi:methylation protein EvaC
MSSCAICNNAIKPFVSFGKQPIANGFLTKDQFKDEYFFDLEVAFCSNCMMVQLVSQPEREKMFNENYAFFSSTSKRMAEHFKGFANFIRKDYFHDKDPFVVELGSNDGIMLRNFAQANIRHLGVEPSANVAEEARKNGINTTCRFFDEEAAHEIVMESGKADAILAANVMCHIPYLHSVLKGMKILLKPTGVVAFEDPYLGDVIEKTSYDQIYDEHMFVFSLSSIKNLFESHDFELIDAIPQSTHGGSMRYVLGHRGAHPVSERVLRLLSNETELGLGKTETYDRFRENCAASRLNLVSLLKDLRTKNKRVLGYAATSKSTTVLNYCQIGPDLIESISDSTPLKQGKFSPGMHIPISTPQEFRKSYPDYAVLFGWNHQAEIHANEQEFTVKGGQWIMFVPKVEIVR